MLPLPRFFRPLLLLSLGLWPALAAVASEAGHGASATTKAAKPAKPAAIKGSPATAPVHWGYEGEHGPAHWAAHFPACNGKRQAPINIVTDDLAGGEPKPLELTYRFHPLRLLNNGHTVQFNANPGSSLRVDGKTYDLVQFHFHRPSEETVNDQAQAMVAHLVHKSEDGDYAVIGVLIKAGEPNELITTLWQYLPTPGQERRVNSVRISPEGLLPARLEYWHYNGSFTTPPCTEGVKFFILQQTVTLSAEQIAAFPFENNARPVQALNGRPVFDSSM